MIAVLANRPDNPATFNTPNVSAELTKVALSGTVFQDCIFEGTDFTASDLSGKNFVGQTFTDVIFDKSNFSKTSFKNCTFINVSFRWSEAKKAIFDGSSMDKLTYALLRGARADLSKVNVI